MGSHSRKKSGLIYNKRIMMLGLMLTIVFICLEARMYKIMLQDSAFYAEKMDRQIYKPIIYYEGFEFKGDIYDRNHKKLTNDGIEHKVVIVPQMAWKRISSGNSKYTTALSLICGDNVDLSLDGLKEKIKGEYEGSKSAVIMTVCQKTGREIANMNLPGIYVKEEYRKYGDKVGIPIIMNFVSNTINSNDLKYEDSVDMKIFNFISKHNRRTLKVPVDAVGNTLPGLSVVEEVKDDSIDNLTKDVVLTLDYDIQSIAEDTLNELCPNNACVSVIDVETGEVLAMASKDHNGWERNMVTYSGRDYAYNPGSVFKIIVLAAALEDNKVSLGTEFHCSGRSLTTGISCYKTGGHGTIGLEDAFAQSCNVYFIELASQVGVEKIISMAQKFGFGQKVLNFSKESKGMLYRDKRDLKYDIGNIAIGQKDIMVTPIQICDMISTIANGGVRNKPYILKQALNSDGSLYEEYKTEKERIISEETARVIQRLLENAVVNGTGRRAQILEGAAGKTGTPERGVRLPSGKYQYEDGWFAGYFPASSPKYGVSVYVEDSGQYGPGSDTAAPIFKAIAEKISLLPR